MTPSITETLLQLADRCEKATGPDRELDTAIQLGRGYSLRQPEGSSRYATVRWHDERGNCISWLETAGDFPPRYTASIDAALTLYVCVPERVPSNPRLAAAEALRQRAADV
jgi:hypothetical protein